MEAVAGTVESSAGVEEFQNDAPNSNKTGVKRKISDKEEDSNVSSEECGAMKKVFVTESENKENELHAEICEPVKVPGYFPFFSLPVELRLRILRKVGYWTLRELRQLSHAMYALVGVVLPRKWGRFLVDYSYSPSMYLEGYLRKRWSHLTSSSSCASMLRLAHRAEIPRIMFFKAKLTPYMMKRFVISVKCSQVKVVELNFTYCKITCDVEQFVHFLELCNTQKLVVDDCTMKGDFRNQLQQAAFIQKIDAVITNSWGCSYWSEPQFFTVEKLLGLLTKMFDKLTGNGNGNKMNMRVHVLEGILSSIETDGSSARVNSLRQVIRRNKADMADDAGKSLDLMRRIFQNEITKELQQIMDRHIRTTFSPAIENLKKNGHVVDQDVINDLYTSILDAAKAPFMRERASTMNRDRLNSERSKRGYESDESDVSILSQGSEIKRRRGRPRKDEEPSSLDLSPFTLHEVLKWSPERHLLTTRYIPAAKVAALLSIPVTVFFSKYPRMFRYSCDEEDRAQLMEEKKLSRGVGRCYLMVMDDVTELLGRSPDLEFSSFLLNEHILLKMRSRTVPVFERLKARLPPSAFTFSQ